MLFNVSPCRGLFVKIYPKKEEEKIWDIPIEYETWTLAKRKEFLSENMYEMTFMSHVMKISEFHSEIIEKFLEEETGCG